MIDPDRDLAEVIERLETDPAFAVASQAEFVDFIQGIQDRRWASSTASTSTSPRRFGRSRSTWSRPARLSAPTTCRPPRTSPARGDLVLVRGRQQLPLWSEVSTAYHEGFPGHHLQVGTVMTLRENLRGPTDS